MIVFLGEIGNLSPSLSLLRVIRAIRRVIFLGQQHTFQGYSNTSIRLMLRKQSKAKNLMKIPVFYAWKFVEAWWDTYITFCEKTF